MTYNSLSVSNTARALADLFPLGDCWNSKNIDGSVFNNLLRGLSVEFVRIQQNAFSLFDTYVPTQANLSRGDFLVLWLDSYMIPDTCLEDLSDEALVVLYTVAKIRGLFTLTTKQSYIDLAIFFGASLEVQYLSTYEIKLIISVSDLSVFPLTFPFIFGSEVGDVLSCLYRSSMPAHIDLTIEIQEA